MFEFFTTLQWSIVFQIVIIDILIGGDNTVVIALACHNLPAHHRTHGIVLGTFGAVLLRVILVAFAMVLFDVPFLKFAGGLLLLWVGVRLMAPAYNIYSNVKPADKLITAVKTIVIADVVMSFDNVIAIAGTVKQADPQYRIVLVIFGLLVSVPLIVWGSQLVLKLLDRFPIVVTFGAALLGWIAGDLIINDPISDCCPIFDTMVAEYGMSIFCALVVVFFGVTLKRRKEQRVVSSLN